MRSVVVLTGSELRHSFFRTALALAPGLRVVRSYCEGLEKSLRSLTEQRADASAAQFSHIDARERSERDFFGTFVALAPDQSSPVFIPKGAVNEPEHIDAIRALAPDLLVAYGCSLIREPLIAAFAGRFVNLHLGLSPYYRGSGTNFWPLVNGEPEFVGVTFMHIDAGVDTGSVIHQIRARIFPGDTPHQIGNRLIGDMVFVAAELVRSFERLPPMPQIAAGDRDRIYRRNDFTDAATQRLYDQFADGLIGRHLAAQAERCAAAPIVVNPALAGVPLP
jgi:hypothetical protein